jgi:hypothetical protein
MVGLGDVRQDLQAVLLAPNVRGFVATRAFSETPPTALDD